jgi:hypothetical protein
MPDSNLPPHMRPRLLTPEQERIIREAWSAGVPRDEVAALAGITIHVLASRFNDQLADLPRRPRGVGGGRRGDVDPTHDEIVERAAEVRQRWPEYRYRGLTADDQERHVGAFHRGPVDRRQRVDGFGSTSRRRS